MEDDYTRKYGGATSSAKPNCYGDIDIYDEADDVCEDCAFRKSCKVIVDKKLQREVDTARSGRGRSSRLSRNPRRPRSVAAVRSRHGGHRETPSRQPPLHDRNREEPGIEDSWWGALLYNAFLSSTSALLAEAQHGIDSIPRIRYPHPFRRRDKEG